MGFQVRDEGIWVKKRSGHTLQESGSKMGRISRLCVELREMGNSGMALGFWLGRLSGW